MPAIPPPIDPFNVVIAALKYYIHIMVWLILEESKTKTIQLTIRTRTRIRLNLVSRKQMIRGTYII